MEARATFVVDEFSMLSAADFTQLLLRIVVLGGYSSVPVGAKGTGGGECLGSEAAGCSVLGAAMVRPPPS